MAEERRKYDVDLTDIKTDIAVIKNQVMSCAEAKKQVYKNEKDIIRMKGSVKLITWCGSAIGLATIATAIRSIFSHFIKH